MDGGAIRTETDVVVASAGVKTLGRPKRWLDRQAEEAGRRYFDRMYTKFAQGESCEPDDEELFDLAFEKFGGRHGEPRAARWALGAIRYGFNAALEHECSNDRDTHRREVYGRRRDSSC